MFEATKHSLAQVIRQATAAYVDLLVEEAKVQATALGKSEKEVEEIATAAATQGHESVQRLLGGCQTECYAEYQQCIALGGNPTVCASERSICLAGCP
jgi:hypothetical protein